jgi:chromosome segregation ATPase
MAAFLTEISQKQQELSAIEDVLRQEERAAKLQAEQQHDEMQSKAAAEAKKLEVTRQELEIASQMEAGKLSIEISQLKLSLEAAEARAAGLERTMAQRSEASAAAVNEVESQVAQRVESLTSMLRLAEQQAASATAQAATKGEWIEKQRTELVAREREVTEKESDLRQREWSVDETRRKLAEQEQRHVATDALHRDRESALEAREHAASEANSSASSQAVEVVEMRRRLEEQLKEVDYARRYARTLMLTAATDLCPLSVPLSIVYFERVAHRRKELG